jgi:hypothetical protein
MLVGMLLISPSAMPQRGWRCAITISSVPQVQKEHEQSGFSLEAVQQKAIASANSIQQEPETVSQVVVTPRIEGFIATSSISEEQAPSI